MKNTYEEIYKKISNEINNIIIKNYEYRHAKSYQHEGKAFEELKTLENKYKDEENIQFFLYDNEVFCGSIGILLHRPGTDIVEVKMFNQNSSLFFFNLHLSDLRSLKEALLNIEQIVEEKRGDIDKL